MNEEFFNSQEFYLVDTFNGIVKKSRIKFNVVNNSKYKLANTRQVAIESKSRKIDSETGEEYYEQSVKYLASHVSIDGKIVKNPFEVDTNGGAPLGTRLR